MSELFLRKNQAPLCEAVCRCLESMGVPSADRAGQGQSVLWFPEEGEELVGSLLPLLEEQKEGSVLVMLPYFWWEGDPEAARRSEWAGGICSAVRALARRFAPKWRINCLRYGWIEGDRIPPDALESVALNRAATVEELVRTALFFAGEGSSYMTGQSIDVNGGRIH